MRKIFHWIFFDSYGMMRGSIFAALLILGILSTIGIVASLALMFDNNSCISQAHGLELEHRWGPLEGCLYRTRGGSWIPAEQYFVNHPEP